MVKSVCGRQYRENRDLCIKKSLTVLRVLHDRCLCKQVSIPSVYFVWPSCHQQGLPGPLDLGCGLWCHMKCGLHCVDGPCSCSCALRMHRSSHGVFPSLAFPSACKKKIMEMNPMTDPRKKVDSWLVTMWTVRHKVRFNEDQYLREVKD